MLKIGKKKEERPIEPELQAVEAPVEELEAEAPVDAGLMSQDEAVADPSVVAPTGGILDQGIVLYLGPEAGPFQCDHCIHWQAPSACQVVSGEIHPQGLCHVFTPGEVPTEVSMPAEELAPEPEVV